MKRVRILEYAVNIAMVSAQAAKKIRDTASVQTINFNIDDIVNAVHATVSEALNV